MAQRTFTVVAGKHIAWAGSDFKGVVSARTDDDMVHNVTCGFWPIAFEYVVPGLKFIATVQSTDHPSYGPQLSARSDIKIVDSRYALNIVAMKKKLTSALAKRLTVLTSKFGPHVFDKFEGVLAESVAAESLLGGSPRVTLEHVRALVKIYESTKQAVLFTETFPPIDTQMALKYADILDVDDVRTDPYALFWRKPSGRVEGNPLHVADAVTKEYLDQPTPPNDPRRMAAYFEAAIKQLQKSWKEETNGSSWFSPNLIISTMMTLQPDDPSWKFDAPMLTSMLSATPAFVAEDDGLFARAKDNCIERSVATKLVDLRRRSDDIDISAVRCLSLFASLYDEVSDAQTTAKELDEKFPSWRPVYDQYIKCDACQRSTLSLLVENGILILMGGAGTGKSTTLGLVIKFACAILNVNMKACALTGKAVDRLKDVCGDEVDCRTLHSQAACTEKDPAVALAIDEASMAFPAIVDKIMTDRLQYLVICGDDKQLPSIDAGAFLRDIVATNRFPTVRLEHIYRTGNGSGIATEAPKIFGVGDAQLPVAPMDVNGFQIVLDNNLENAVRKFGHIVRNGAAPDDVIMISNTRRTCKDANRELQPLCNTSMSDPLTQRLVRGQGYAPWIVGDRIISKENIDLEEGQRIFNGMLGTVSYLDLDKKKLGVRFRNILKMFDAGDAAIDHAYCVTTWKFQGSEIKHAIVFFDSTWGLSCELLYTAATRGQVSTAMYLSQNDLKLGLATRIGPKRVTRLVKRIESAAKKRQRDDDDESDAERHSHPAEGMAGAEADLARLGNAGTQ